MKAFGKLFGSAAKSKASPTLHSESAIQAAATVAVSSQSSNRSSLISNIDPVHTNGSQINTDTSKSRISSDSLMVAEIEENERWDAVRGWSHRHLRSSDPKHFKSSAGQSDHFPNPPLSTGWIYDGEW